MTLYERIVAGYRFLNRWAGPLTLALFLLVMRLDWGHQLYITGKGHFANFSQTVQNFTDWHFPLPRFNALLASTMEVTGGVSLMLGLFSRPIAAAVTVQMIVAFLTPADDRALFLGFFDPNNNIPWKIIVGTPFFFMLTSILVFACGSGWFSIDAILKRFVFGQAQTKAIGNSVNI